MGLPVDAITTDVPSTLRLGNGPVIKRLGLGAMRITGPGVWGFPPDEAAAIALLRRAVEQGINFIDTADSYGPEVSETLIANALHPYPDGLVVASKGGFVRPGPGSWEIDARPDHLRMACEGSLKRLRMEQIPLYQLHCVDRRVPIEESIGALVDLQRAGKIGQIGVSNVTVAELARARVVAEIVSVQNVYNLHDRSSNALVELCAAEGMAFIPYYPLRKGRLDVPGSSLAAALTRIAESRHATPRQIALAWLLHRSPTMLPIPGTGSAAHLDENLGARDLHLGAAELRELSARPVGLLRRAFGALGIG